MSAQEMPIFIRSYEFLSWLVPISNHFPRSSRFTFTQRLLNAAFDLSETLQSANLKRGTARKECLNEADLHLDKVRFYLRLAVRWQWLSPGQYQHAAKMVAEIGRLLGGWKKIT
jgi:hypothetical protein